VLIRSLLRIYGIEALVRKKAERRRKVERRKKVERKLSIRLVRSFFLQEDSDMPSL